MFQHTWFLESLKIVQAILVGILFLNNRPSPVSFLFIFVFSNNFYNNCRWKMYIHNTVLDLNPWPSENVSPPITTRPGRPINLTYLLQMRPFFPKMCLRYCSCSHYTDFIISLTQDANQNPLSEHHQNKSRNLISQKFLGLKIRKQYFLSLQQL